MSRLINERIYALIFLLSCFFVFVYNSLITNDFRSDIMGFKHFTYNDRLQLEAFLRVGIKIKDIAVILGFSRVSVYREIKRGRYEHLNTDYTTEIRYSPELAEEKYREHLKAKGPALKIGSDRGFADYIEYKICSEGYSPAAVLGEIKVRGLDFKTTVSKSTLYSYIDKGIFLTLTNKALPVKRNRLKHTYRRVRPKRAPRGTSIEKRPEDIAARVRAGHWEMDCVVGKSGSKRALLVLTERYSRFEIIRMIPDKTMRSVVMALDGIERKCGADTFRSLFKSITVDNGSEFSDAAGMERSINGGRRTSVYYCHPYSAYERGSNENANKLIRRFYPKGTSFDRVGRRAIRKLEDWMNHYPREVLGWRCAADVLRDCLTSL